MSDTGEGEGAPVGRTDPGGGISSKIGPLPLWGWVLVGGGIFAFIWWRGRSSSNVPTSTDVTGSASSLPADAGVTSTDPMTADSLLAAMQQQAATEASLQDEINKLEQELQKLNGGGGGGGGNIGRKPPAQSPPASPGPRGTAASIAAGLSQSVDNVLSTSHTITGTNKRGATNMINHGPKGFYNLDSGRGMTDRIIKMRRPNG